MTSSAPLVSICLPTYNRPEYLRRTVESCLAQTYKNFEIVVTDNSTNTESAEMIKKINDPRIHYYSNNGNIGACASGNRANSLAVGKYIKCLMDDDLLKPRCLELMVDAFEKNPSVAVVMAPMDLIDENDTRIFPKFYMVRTMTYRYRYQVGDALIPQHRLLKDFLTRDYPCSVPSAIMFRGDSLRRFMPFDENAHFAADLDMCMQMAAHYDFYYIDQVLSSWRWTPTCHTARLHKSGVEMNAFYHITRKTLAFDSVKKMFSGEWNKLERDSMFFCSCRCVMLNGMAAVRGRSPRLLLHTMKTVVQQDKHWINYFRIPFWGLRQVFASFFAPKLPPARE